MLSCSVFLVFPVLLGFVPFLFRSRCFRLPDFLFLFDCFLCCFFFLLSAFCWPPLILFWGFCVWTLALLSKLTFFVFIKKTTDCLLVYCSALHVKIFKCVSKQCCNWTSGHIPFFIIIAYYCILQLQLFNMSSVRFPGSLQCSECRQSPWGPACRSDIPEAVSFIPGLSGRLTAWTPTSLSGCCSLLVQLCSPPTVHMKHSFIPV